MSEKTFTTPQPEHDEDLSRMVFTAMRDRGWLVPMTEAEVVKAEEELETNAPTLPPALNDPYAVFDCAESIRPAPDAFHQRRLPLDNDAEVSLTRAARGGKEISKEIEERMRRDRRHAEREALTARTAE